MVKILQHTPQWVFLIFVMLVILGGWQTRLRRSTFARLAILPAVMIALSAYGVMSAFGGNVVAWMTWAIGFICIGVLWTHWGATNKITYDAATHLYHIPGSFQLLLLMMLIFILKYAVSASLAMDLPFVKSLMFICVTSSIYGGLSGMFLARLFVIRRSSINGR
ncbi:MAG: DUF6622 family protein [Saezia sp.]